jgi:HAE1 family hydrophobic/amphiphilic exporter-1
MSRFAIRFPYFIIVCGLIACILGGVSLTRMSVDLFPDIKIPVVVVATFYSGMPAEQVEKSITSRFERFFTLASNIDHIESRSMGGVSLIKIYFQPGTNADSAVTSISNLAMANLRRLPPGTLPPVVLKFDASSLPVCLITLKADGLSEAKLRDVGQYTVRNQVAGVPGAAVPQPFGGKYRQIMVYVDPAKLEAQQLSAMDVVRSVNEANLIMPAGSVKIGPREYNLMSNSQADTIADVASIPLKTVGNATVTVADVATATDAAQIQSNIVRVDGQPSVYLPVLRQGGDANTIAIVEGVKDAVADLPDAPKNLITKVVFDQSVFVKNAIHNLMHEGAIGLVLTGAMILIFLGNMRATVGVFLSIPLSVLTTFLVLALGGTSVNSMILGGLALVFSRLIDNSVVVLENIYRHLELGETPAVAAEKGGREVALPVLAATLTTAIVFFPVTILYGVSQFLFSALALAVVIALAISYIVALTVVPLFCAKYLKAPHDHTLTDGKPKTISARFNHAFNRRFERLLDGYSVLVNRIMEKPRKALTLMLALCVATFVLFPLLGTAFFPPTDPGQFVVNLKAPTGSRLEVTTQDVAKLEAIIRRVVAPKDLDVVVSNIGNTPGFSAMYTSNTGSHTAFVQASLKQGHKTASKVYMERVRAAVRDELPYLRTYFQTGGLVDAVLNMGLPAPINVQVSGSDLTKIYENAETLSARIKALSSVGDVFIPQDIDAPTLRLNVNRTYAAQMGLSQKEVVSNVVTALSSNQMIAPSFWIDPKNGNDYLLTVQYPENTIKNLDDVKAISLRGSKNSPSTRLDTVLDMQEITSPTVIDHYQLKRVIDIYVTPKTENLGRTAADIQKIISNTTLPEGVRVTMRGSFEAMQQSFHSFGVGLVLSLLLVYLVLVAQFKSFVDPFLILLAIPPALAGVLLILSATGTTLNVMSLMGVVMLMGIAVSNSILILEFTHQLRHEGMPLSEAVVTACRVRLRPVLMTSLATIIGLIPMALALGEGSETYAPLALAIIGGLTVSVLFTVFLVPVGYLLVYGRRDMHAPAVHVAPASMQTDLAA